MRALIGMVLLMSAGFLFSTTTSADQVVYNSFPPNNILTDSANIGNGTGQVFEAALFSPSATVNLTSLSAKWADCLNMGVTCQAGPASVTLWTVANGQPANLLESWAFTPTPGNVLINLLPVTMLTS